MSAYLKFPPTISRKPNRKYILLHEDYIEGVYAVTATINDAVYSLRLRVIRINYNVPYAIPKLSCFVGNKYNILNLR